MNTAKLSRDDFIARFSGIYENSPHFAAAVWDADAHKRPPAQLYEAFRNAVDKASEGEQYALIRAHPDLADRVSMSAESTREQASAGLDSCTLAQVSEFQTLNEAYKAKFDFPFIIAVRGLTPERILTAFRGRLEEKPEEEFKMALYQIHRIAMLRLQDLLGA